MDKIQALDSFWNSFGVKAYDESTVPDEMSFLNPKNTDKNPYITYEVNIGDYGENTPCAVSVWYYDKGWKKIENKIKEIDERISEGGIQIPYDNGTIWIKRSQPYRSRVGESNDMTRRYLINLLIEFH